MTSTSLPTHAEISTFLETFLPPQANSHDVPYLFHAPRHPRYSPTRQLVSRLVLSITPTAGFYTALNRPSDKRAAVGFLHRPWRLDRRGVRKGSLILASHQSFDAHLTVGWNEGLATRLGLCLQDAVCIQGYKGNPDRKIGLVAPFDRSTTLPSIVDSIRNEFDGAGDLFEPKSHAPDDRKRQIDVVAIMNAFHAEEIERVLNTVRERAWAADCDPSRILYLTGAARNHGIEAADQAGMPALCVGHSACEEWGVRYLAEQTRSRWPALEVAEILEEEDAPSARFNTVKESAKSLD